jgi:hypothetical protein
VSDGHYTDIQYSNQTSLYTTHTPAMGTGLQHAEQIRRQWMYRNLVPPRLRRPMVTFLLTDTSFWLNAEWARGERGATRRINDWGVSGCITARRTDGLASWLLRTHCVSPKAYQTVNNDCISYTMVAMATKMKVCGSITYTAGTELPVWNRHTVSDWYRVYRCGTDIH